VERGASFQLASCHGFASRRLAPPFTDHYARASERVAGVWPRRTQPLPPRSCSCRGSRDERAPAPEKAGTGSPFHPQSQSLARRIIKRLLLPKQAWKNAGCAQNLPPRYGYTAASSCLSVFPAAVFHSIRPLAWPPRIIDAAPLGLVNS